MRPDLSAHSRVDDRYEVVERLPDGPLGHRWRALDARGPDVRLTWLPGATWSADLAARMVRFGHVGTVLVRDVGLHDGGVFVACAPPSGRPLRAFLRDLPGPLPLRDARAIIEQVAQTLAAAHRGIDGTPLVHGGPLMDCVWVETRGETRQVAVLDDLCLAALAGTEVRAADDVAALGDLLEFCLVGDLLPSTERDGAARRLRPEVHPSVWEIARASRAARAGEPLTASRVRELIRAADWTLQAVAPSRDPTPEPPRLSHFERAPPVETSRTQTPPAERAAPPAAERPPAPALPARASPRSAPVRAQLGRRLGFLSAGERRASDTLRTPREETSWAVALPPGDDPKDQTETLKPSRRLAPPRRATTEASLAGLGAAPPRSPDAASGDGRFVTLRPRRFMSLDAARPPAQEPPSNFDEAPADGAAHSIEQVHTVVPPLAPISSSAWQGETVALETGTATPRAAAWDGDGHESTRPLTMPAPTRRRGLAAAIALLLGILLVAAFAARLSW